MNEDVADLLRTGLAEISGPANALAGERWITLLLSYIDDLYCFNDAYGLISTEDASDPAFLAVRHVLDSVAGAPVVAGALRHRNSRVVCDLGSGAGLPGIPLGVVLAMELDRCYLVERRERRVQYLVGATARLELSSVSVLKTDADRPTLEASKVFRADPPPVVVFRAYRKTTESFLRGLVRVFPPETMIVAWKGRRSVAEEEAALIEDTPGMRMLDIPTLHVPFLDRERSLLVFTRVSQDG